MSRRQREGGWDRGGEHNWNAQLESELKIRFVAFCNRNWKCFGFSISWTNKQATAWLSGWLKSERDRWVSMGYARQRVTLFILFSSFSSISCLLLLPWTTLFSTCLPLTEYPICWVVRQLDSMHCRLCQSLLHLPQTVAPQKLPPICFSNCWNFGKVPSSPPPFPHSP